MANRSSRSSFDDYYTQQEPDDRRQSTISRMSIPSFSSFRAHTPPVPAISPVRRKPVPSNAAVSYSTEHENNGELTPTVWPPIFDPPRQPLGRTTVNTSPLPLAEEEYIDQQTSTQGQDLMSSTSRDQSTTFSFELHHPTGERLDHQRLTDHPALPFALVRSATLPVSLDNDNDYNVNGERKRVGRPLLSRVASETFTLSTRSKSRSPIPASHLQTPDMAVLQQQSGLPRSISDISIGSNQFSNSPSKRKNSPTSKFSSFFGWKSASPKPDGVDSPSTSFSEHSNSPSSPFYAKRMPLDRSISAPRLTPPAIDVSKANAPSSPFYESAAVTPFTARSSSLLNTAAAFEELERELKDVSTELAGSIRREMELEDELDRCKIEMPAGEGLTRRTSDYFSDSGASATKFPITDLEAKVEELETTKRKLEQDRAQIKADYSTKFADELRKRRDLETQISRLETELQERQSSNGAETDDRLRELETFLEESRRRLSQERQSRDNFEDLLAALRSELASNGNERDNLRDEVVPQLKSRIEGLEAEAAEASTLRYENTRMQQELQNLRGEVGLNTPVRASFASGHDDLNDLPNWARMGNLGRSSSVLGRKPSTNTLRRNGSVKGRPEETISLERVKDIEDQRDALHHALKNLIRRHDAQKREHSKAIQKLIVDRSPSRPASMGHSNYTREVSSLREHIVSLRKRADEALEQKWQLENTFGGVKLALDRAQQETRSLRSLLASNDYSAQNALGISMAEEAEATDATSMIKVLRRSIQLAQTERENALREARAYRERAASMIEEESEELLQSANKMEDLAAELEKHLEANISLRERLAQAVGEGERQQSVSTQRVVEMQSKLKNMEDELVAAQQQSESTLEVHDETARSLSHSSTPQVQRLNLTIPSPLPSAYRSPSLISPRMNSIASAKGETLFDATKTATLQKRVNELELALAEADNEMKGVVEKIESSQYEIAALQGERDDATREMRRLQGAIATTKAQAQKLMN